MFDPVDPLIPKCARCRAPVISEADKEAQEAMAGRVGEEENARRLLKQQLKDKEDRFKVRDCF